METMDSHPGDGDHDLPDVEPEPASQRAHWLSGLVRADALALTAIVATAAALVGVPFLEIAMVPFYVDPEGPGLVWRYAPQLGIAAVAIAAGLLGLRQAVAQQSPGWVRALAGASVLISTVLAIAIVVVWLFTPDLAESFRELEGPF